jgi:hypothetical protein
MKLLGMLSSKVLRLLLGKAEAPDVADLGEDLGKRTT